MCLYRREHIKAELNVQQLQTDAELQLRSKLLDGGLEDLRRREQGIAAEEARLRLEEARIQVGRAALSKARLHLSLCCCLQQAHHAFTWTYMFGKCIAVSKSWQLLLFCH